MRGSSINFKQAKNGALNHNDRTEALEVKYLLPEEYRKDNEWDLSATQANEKMKILLETASINYKKIYHQKLQAKSYLWEAVVNLDSHHTLEDLKNLNKKLEKITGFTAVQSAVHNDEGSVLKDENGNHIIIYNHHAHVIFFTLNVENGTQLYRKDIPKPVRKKYKEEVVTYQNIHKRLQPPFHPNAIQIRKKKSKWTIENRVEINKDIRQKFKNDGYIVYDRDYMSYLQTIVADELGMPRGSVSVEAEAKRLGVTLETNPAVRKEHQQYKAGKREEEKIRAIHLEEVAALKAAHEEFILNLEQEKKALENKIIKLNELVYSNIDASKNGQKTGDKLTFVRLTEILKQQKDDLKKRNKELSDKLVVYEEQSKPTGYDIEGVQVSEEVYDIFQINKKDLYQKQNKIKTLEEKLQDSTERIEERGRIYSQTIEKLQGQIDALEKLAYTGQEYPIEFDEDNNPAKFEKETYQSEAEWHRKENYTLRMENDGLIQLTEEQNDKIDKLEHQVNYYEKSLSQSQSKLEDLMVEKDSLELDNVIYEKKLQVSMKIINILKEYDVPREAFSEDIYEMEDKIIDKVWAKKKEKNDGSRGIGKSRGFSI